MLYHTQLDSPLGTLLLFADDLALVAVQLPNQKHARTFEAEAYNSHPILQRTQQQLSAYFAGERQHFDLPLAPQGTDFQRQVWAKLREIPFGETWSYGDLARAIDRPKASRAVGAANGQNPIGVIIPCHRVIGAAGTLTGYAGGVERKSWLLQHEGAWQPPPHQQIDLFSRL